jgi:RHS repeat-associated protein
MPFWLPLALLAICWAGAASAQAAGQDAVGDKISVAFTGYTLNRYTNTFDTIATLTNTSGVAVSQPVSLAVTGINPATVTLANPSGQTAGGFPYVVVPLADGRFDPGERVTNVLLKFKNPKRVGFSFTRALYGVLATANQPPTAHAGPDRSAQVGEALTLDASASSDPDGDPLTYHWTLTERPANSTASLTAATGLSTGFSIDKPGSYRLRLVVNDGTADSAPALVVISTVNSKPLADAGADQTVLVGQTATLDGSASSDADADPITFLWSLTQRPADSSTGLTNPDTDSPRLAVDRAGHYEARLVVNDGQTDSAPDLVAIDTRNSPPVADAGPDVGGVVGDTIQLDGGASADVDGDLLTYAWSLLSQPTGSAAFLQDDTAPVCRLQPDEVGDYVAQLVVHDGTLGSSPDTARVTVSVEPPPVNHDPVITSTPNTLATVGELYQYAVAATDEDGDTLGFSLMVAPAGLTIDPPSGLVQWTPAASQTGDQVVAMTVQDPHGASDSQTFTIAVSLRDDRVTAPALVGLSRADAEALIRQAQFIVGALGFQHSAQADGLVLGQSLAAGTKAAVGTAIDLSVSLGPDLGLPPNPATVAPAVDQTVATTLAESTEFLYSGPNPIQTLANGQPLAEGTIEARRAAVIRGKVTDKQDNPLAGVTVSILGRPELGQTLTRTDGRFDLVVNGGGPLTVDYRMAGYLPAQRQVHAPWQDYALIDDLVLIQLDSQVTAVDLANTATVQVARGNPVGDADGTRQATVLFPPGTQATMTLPDGSSQPLTTLHVRATEYTVGTNGPNAMPGELPPSSGYTYAVELSADEAVAVGATTVRFSQPVPFYVENFVGFPVGSLVPTGFYDRIKGQWIASANGRVIKVLGITNGLADLDLDGNVAVDDAAALAALAITDAERQRLAGLYLPGQSLWRVLLPHLTPWDCNWPFGPPPGSQPPSGSGNPKPGPNPDKPPKGDPCNKGGSIIGCETQTLGEVIDVTGTPWSLHYQSDRVPGRQGNRTLPIRLSGATLPPDLQRIHLEITVAGQTVKKSFAPQPNLVDTFTWDGKDAYGRPVQGQQPVTVRIGFEYIAQYFATPDSFEASFNGFGSPPIAVARGSGGGSGGSAVVFSRPAARLTTPPIILWQDYQVSPGSLVGLGLVGGWSLSVHHFYDVVGQTLYLGNGDQRSATATGEVITTVAGTGVAGFAGDGGLAIQGRLSNPQGAAVGPDGSLYIADTDNQRIRRVGLDGVITTVAGTVDLGFTGDGGPATQARLSSPRKVAVGPDGSVYVSDASNHRIRRVGPDGIITTVAGNGVRGFDGDGGLATQAQLARPQGAAVGPEGSLYIADGDNHRIRRVGLDGIITTVAGTSGFGSFAGDGGLATLARLDFPVEVAVGADGSLYIADSGNKRIRRVGPDGIIATIAGTDGGGFAGDGGPATQARLGYTQGVSLGSDGSVYILDSFNRIRHVGSDGIINTVAGSGFTGGFAGDGGPATQAQLGFPQGFAVGFGSVYIADTGNQRIRQLSPPLPESSFSDIAIAAEDGSELYVFTGAGRHLRTLDALTGAVRLQFTYNSAGRLATITDGDGNLTTIERDGSGNPTAIVAPFGQRTTLAVNGDGYLSRVTNPAGEAVQLAYHSGDAEGLLATLTDPRGNVHRYTYGPLGRLIRDENPAGGVTTLARTELTDDHYAVNLTTALGLVTTYEVEDLPTGDQRRVRIEPSGARTESLIRTDGSRRVTYPDGTVANQVEGPDPRFGMQAPILKTLTVTMPGGMAATRTATRTATLSAPNNPLSLTSQTDTVAVNGQIYTRTYAAATRQVTATTPAGRQSVATLDSLSRVVEQNPDVNFGLEPEHYSVDLAGRLTKVQQGTQFWTFDYDAQNRLAARTDAAGSSIDYGYDAADRPTQVTLPSNRSYRFSYDPNGNRTEVTMPDLGIHLLDYTPINLEASYAPPGNSAYVTSYDTDRRVNQVTLPGGRTETYSYDNGNRSTGLVYPEAAVVLTYASGDATQRVSRITRAPVGGGASQATAFSYNGSLVTGTTWSGAASGQYTYAYDSNFLLKSMVLNSGADTVTTLLTRDNDGLLTAMGPFTFTRSGPAGDPSQISDGTLTIALGYDLLGRIESRTHSVGGQPKYAVQFTYDTVGRIARKVETIAGTAQTYDYAYDADSQLSEVRREGVVVERYTYDPNRNRLSRQLGNNASQIASYDDQDRLFQHGAVAYQFNADGYLTQRGNDTFQYSTTGELLQATVGGQTLTYAYDGLRRRVSRTDAAGTTQYLYGNPVEDLQVSNSRDPAGVLTTYYYDDGRRLFALQRGNIRYYVATDHLGSPRVITDATGSLVKVVEYDSFGNITLDSNPAFHIPIGFAGGVADGTTRFVRFGLRDYDPIVGRWTARDPAVFSSNQTNLYAYVNNNPVNLVDPVGFSSGGVSLCEGFCVGLKLGWVPGEGISACVEAGVGKGSSVAIDPFGGLDDTGSSFELKGGVKAGRAKLELGVDVPYVPCDGTISDAFLTPKGKLEGCLGPICGKADDGSFKGKISLDEQGKFKNPLEAATRGWSGKAVTRICQQAKW